MKKKSSVINIYSIRPKGFNIGNDVIYVGVNHFIRKAFAKNFNVISLPATSKYESHRKSGLGSQTIHEINRFGDGVVVGGGNLYENGELEVSSIALQALEKPMMIFSVSRGKIFNDKLQLVNRTDVMPDDKIKLLNDRADVSMSRDLETKKHIDTLGCHNVLGGCPTLFINEVPQHLVPILDVDKTDALISIRTPTLMNIPVSLQYELRDQLIEMISVLKDKGYTNIKILCHDHRDIPFASSFSDLDYLYTEDVYTFLSYLRNTRLNLTFRLHSFIPCLSYGIPTIKICYDQRALSMLETLGLDGWGINMIKDDVIAETKNRLNSIGELEVLKSKLSKTVWAGLYETICSQCGYFENLVRKQGDR